MNTVAVVLFKEEKIMNVHRVEAVVGSDKTLTLKDLPFNEGEEIEVIVLGRKNGGKNKKASSLRGTLLKYEEPFEPVAEENWEVLK